MKHIISFTVIFLLFSCKEHKSTKDYDFKEIGWTVSIPSDFTILTSTEAAKVREATIQAVKQAYDSTYYYDSAKTLLSFKKGSANYFSAGITPFKEVQDGDWLQSTTNKKELILNTFKSQNPEAKIDTSSSIRLIDGLTFEVFKVKMSFPDTLVITSNIYSRLVHGYNFTMSLAYVNEDVGRQLNSICISSKFAK